MKKVILFCMVSLMVFGCKKTESKTEVVEKVAAENEEVVQQKEPTKPEETEIWKPEPKKVNVADNGLPSDAIVLFDGSNLDAWTSYKKKGAPAEWILNKDGSMTVANGVGDIQTKQLFGSCQLHIEWKNPKQQRADGQHAGNSGVFFQDRYEVQVLDNYTNKTYVNGQAASIYKQYAPLVNASRPSGEWQIYDIIFHAPEFDSQGNKVKSGSLTVLHNGILVQDNVEILGTTEYIGFPKNVAHGKAALKLQDHNDNSGVSYRNIWIREL